MSDAKPIIPDVLASRYASAALCRIWSPQGRVLSERELWIAVMKAQRELGVDVSEQAIAAYERVKTQVDLASIDQRERVSRHDVKARIEEFCALAGHETIHMGMTSRDLTDNVEQLQVRRSLLLLRDKTIAALVQLAAAAEQYKETLLVGRTHHVPAQPTTLGKRLAMFGEELLRGWERLQFTLETYPLRGLKGAVGTQLDLISLLNGAGSVQQLEAAIAAELGFARVLNAVGQVYPRSLDYEVLSALYQVGAGLADFATSMRLMTGHELVSEGFGKEQVGSSAMPHKMNARSCERIDGFQTLLAGYLEMTARLAGNQWNEGDVACSVVRRVALPQAMFALDGALETFLTVVDEMEVYESSIAAEVQRQLPFLATTTLLMAAVKAGGGRERMHEVIRGHSVAVARGLREGSLTENDLAARLEADPDFPLGRDSIQDILSDPSRFLGAAPTQVDAFLARVETLRARFPEAAAYRPEPIL
ncbi:MAG: adenylosuccinate lyase [SAR324 cluster bacterium]|nr:adenylosuccinate lyase [SAR324 cluster bacterium]